jgi:hypothetical protein
MKILASFCKPGLAEKMLQASLFVTTDALDLHCIPDFVKKSDWLNIKQQ